jgi:ribonuclease P protein component
MALAKKNRIKTKKDFDKVFKKGKTVKGSFLFLKVMENELSYSRFGIITPSKLLPRAHQRNHLKRLISESVRIHIRSLKYSVDGIFSISIKPASINLEVIKEEVDSLLKYINLIND